MDRGVPHVTGNLCFVGTSTAVWGRFIRVPCRASLGWDSGLVSVWRWSRRLDCDLCIPCEIVGRSLDTEILDRLTSERTRARDQVGLLDDIIADRFGQLSAGDQMALQIFRMHLFSETFLDAKGWPCDVS